MGVNPRIYLRSVQKILFENNPFFAGILKFKKMIFVVSELSLNSKDISKKISERQNRLESTKTTINSEFMDNSKNYINILR